MTVSNSPIWFTCHANQRQARNACNEAYGNIHEAIRELRPECVKGRDFVTLLRDLLEQFADDTRLQVQLELEGIAAGSAEVSQLFPPVTSRQLSRVVQESLSIIRTHTSATRVIARLSVNPPAGQETPSSGGDLSLLVVLTIRDDGCGFDLASAPGRGQHFGLTNMRERIEAMDGRFEIGSHPGQGTTLQVCLPAPPAYAAEPAGKERIVEV